MTKKHDAVLRQVFSSSTPSNIKWNDVKKMILHYGGEVEEREGSRTALIIREKVLVLHRPHPKKEMDKNAVRELKKFLSFVNLLP